MRKGRKSANSIIRNINASFMHVTPTLFDKCYGTFIRSHLEYSFQAWWWWLKTDIKLLGDVQRRSTKLVKCLQVIECEERAELLNFDSLPWSMNKGNTILAFKIFWRAFSWLTPLDCDDINLGWQTIEAWFAPKESEYVGLPARRSCYGFIRECVQKQA